jgi:hypothetical protein
LDTETKMTIIWLWYVSTALLEDGDNNAISAMAQQRQI